MKNVLLIDSGSGGVNILKECLKVCPNANYLMFCDNKNLPYGNKDAEELIKITFENLILIEKIFKYDIVVFACNTLTSTCIDACRENFKNVEFVGTEPAIKPALQEFEEKDIVVLATAATIKHNKLIIKHPNLKCKEMKNLASLIDANLDDLSVLEGYLKAELEQLNAKAVVLGCTHYVAVKEIIKKILPDVNIYDSANGVARRLKTLLASFDEGCGLKIITSEKNDMWGKLWYYLNAEN